MNYGGMSPCEAAAAIRRKIEPVDELLRHVMESREAVRAATAEEEPTLQNAIELLPPDAPGKFRLKTFESVEYEEPRFLFRPYVPLGKVTIVQGDPGVGKTALCCKLAAAVSVGGLMQDVPSKEGKVLILSTEDEAPTLRGRIEASGGNVARCLFVDETYELHFQHEALGPLIGKSNASLVVFDPIQSFLGARTDMHRANETRPIMDHLATYAKQYGCAILLVSHMSKGTAGGRAIYRALGSVDFAASCRSLLYVGRNPCDPEQCAIVHVKSSNAPNGKSILYRIGDHGGVTWEGYCNLTESDLERQPKDQSAIMPYTEMPLVRFLQTAVRENPGGVFLPWGAFNRYALAAVGQKFGNEGREIKTSLTPFLKELAQRDSIYLTFPRTKQREKEHCECGVSIQPSSKYPSSGVFIEVRGLVREFHS